MTKWLSIRTTPEITRILYLVRRMGYKIGAWVGLAITEKAARDGFDKYETDKGE